MQRAVISSCSGEVESRVETFLTDIRGLVLDVTASSVGAAGDGRQESAPASKTDCYGRDYLIYQRACGMRMGMAGMVAFSVDSID